MIITLTIDDPNGSDSNLLFPSTSRYQPTEFGSAFIGIAPPGAGIRFHRYVNGVVDTSQEYELRGQGSDFAFTPREPFDVTGIFTSFELKLGTFGPLLMHMSFSADAAWPGGVPLSGLYPLTPDSLVSLILSRSDATFVVNGNVGPDVLHGSFWNDELHGGPGADTMYGGDGIDTLSYTFSQTGVTINLATGAASGGDALGDRFFSMENVIGSDFRDTITGDANANFIDGALGYDVIRGGGGDDFIFGRNGGGILYGEDGNDRVDGGVDNDVIYGGRGNDELRVGTGVNTAYGEDGDDFLLADAGNDRLYGGAGTDRLDGGNGTNLLDGGLGIDTMNGGFNNDTYYVDNVRDVVNELFRDGIDVVYASVSYRIAAGHAIETLRVTNPSATTAIDLTGNETAQTILGGAGANKLTGLAGIDRLYGYGGADTLAGGTENDYLNGGLGNDTFLFNAALANNIDTIADFANASGNNDVIHLENAIFRSLTTANVALNAAFFAANTDGVAQDTNDYIVYETDTGKLFYDRDGSGNAAAIQFALVANRAALTAADFFVV